MDAGKRAVNTKYKRDNSIYKRIVLFFIKKQNENKGKSERYFCFENKYTLFLFTKVILIDDVISTGDSLAALKQLAEDAGATVVGQVALLAEGDATKREDILYLAELPLFD